MSLSVRVLGCGTPYPTPGNPCSGYLVDASGALVLVELGSGVWAELLRHVNPANLAGIWLSHLHPDHCGDVFAAYQWAANTSGVPRLPVYGLAGWADRLGAALPVPNGGDQLRELFDVREHETGSVRLHQVALTAVAVQHSVPAFGLRLVHDGATFAFSGDSGPCESLAALAAGADLFVCEAGSPQAGQKYHCAPEEAARLAADARRVVLTHLPPGLTPVDAARRAGGVDVARPGLVIDIS